MADAQRGDERLQTLHMTGETSDRTLTVSFLERCRATILGVESVAFPQIRSRSSLRRKIQPEQVLPLLPEITVSGPSFEDEMTSELISLRGRSRRREWNSSRVHSLR